MADVGDPALSLVMNRRLIGAARLQVVIANELHIAFFFLLRLSRGRKANRRWPARRRQRAPGATRGDAADSDNGIAKGFLSLVPQFGNEIGRDALMGVPL